MSTLTVDTLEIRTEPPVVQDSDLQKALDRCIGGATFLSTKTAGASAVWGTGDGILWSSREPCYLVGPQGVGKSTIAQQLVLARVGIRPPTLLGLDVATDARPVLYFASDRAAQVARSLARMVGPDDLAALEERLVVFSGPPTFDIRTETEMLLRIATALDAGTVVIDSAKDLAPDLDVGTTGAAFNTALQHLIESGREVLVLHHRRKANGLNKKPKTLDDVYGSTFLTSGAGSVLMLWGEAGDAVVDLQQLKIPVEQVGPLRVLHDHETGTSTLAEPPPNELDILRKSRHGITAQDLAVHLADGQEPNKATVERARRKLDRLVRDQLAHKRAGDKRLSQPDTWVAAVTS